MTSSLGIELTGLYDCARLARELGVSRKAAEAIMRHLPKVGVRRVRGDHVQAYLDDHLVAHEPTTVYLAHDNAGRLLYVGITGRDIRRLHAHAKSSAWWEKTTTIALEHWENRKQAERREYELIRDEDPRYNIAPGIAPRPTRSDLTGDAYRERLLQEMP